MPLVALIPEAAQRALHGRSDSPTRHARLDVEEIQRVSTGGSLHIHGFLPGWLSLASSPMVLEIMWMILSQVSFPPYLSPVLSLTRTHSHVRSVVISLGSPALTAYSLTLTSLNDRFVYRKAQSIKHESGDAVARALASLQQIPLELTRNEHLLAFIPVKERWREEVDRRLNRRHVWPLAIGSSVTWVTIAFVFTLINSFVSLDASPDGGSEGLAVGFLWLWFLCLVIGWLWVPAFTRKLPERTQIMEGAKLVAQETELKHNPLLSPTHHQYTIPSQPPSGHQLGDTHMGASGSITANHSATTLYHPSTEPSTAPHTSIHPKTDDILIDISNNLGPLNRDELRLSATFNYSRIIRYLILVENVFRALDKPTRGNDEVSYSREHPTLDYLTNSSQEGPAQPTGGVVFPPGALMSMVNASILALILQWGTTAAAVIIVVLTPTIGFGCRSLGYTIYGGISTLILILTIISTISARISETRLRQSTGTFSVKGFTASTAIVLRRLSLFLAFANVTLLIVLSSFQFSHFFNNCYCNASVIGRGTSSYITISFEGWISTMKAARISATVIAATSIAIYMSFLRLMRALSTGVDRP